MSKKLVDLWVVFYFGPSGLDWVNFEFTDEKADLFHWTRGEGTAISFKMDDIDAADGFYRAIMDNDNFIRDVGHKIFETDLRKQINERFKQLPEDTHDTG